MDNSSVISPLFPVHADELLSAGKLAEAVALCEQGVAAFPRYSTGYLIAAKAYAQAKRYAEALAMCDTGLSYTPSSKALLKMRELIAISKQQNETPEQVIQESIEGAAEAAVEDETPMAKLARELKTAKIPQIDASAPLPQELKEEPAPESGAFVSATLAGIYEKQGAYEDAIKAYAVLAERTPAMRDEYNKKIEALNEKKNASKNIKR